MEYEGSLGVAVNPHLKKRSLDPSELSNYNLPFIGEMIEKVVLIQLNNMQTVC